MTNSTDACERLPRTICYHTAAAPQPKGEARANQEQEKERSSSIVARISHEQAYPGIRFRPSSRNWWAWLKGTPAECIHLDREHAWIATLVPDTLYLCGKAAIRRQPSRPEVSLCRDCLTGVLLRELSEFPGKVVAFEPDAESFSQYFFVAPPDLAPAGLKPEVAAAIQLRLGQDESSCAKCRRPANWLWFSREQVGSLDDVAAIEAAPGEHLCPAHGAQRLCDALEAIDEASVYYMNLPYGESGAYVWI
jgi:hypothetical protein